MNNEIILANVAPDENPALNHTDNSDHALTGKIARLPGDLREQINQRIFDGQSDPEILPWLNELPVVKEMLAANSLPPPSATWKKSKPSASTCSASSGTPGQSLLPKK